MAGIHFDITGENKNFLNALNGAESGVKKTTDAIERSGMEIETMFERIKTAASTALAGFTVAEFAKKVALVRGEFQQLEVAFQTMLGSAQQARDMMSDLTTLAATTPFDLQGVANGAKQLLAYGMEAEKVTDTLRRLGDISAGLGISINDMTYLYGTTMSQGRLYTQDLNQFTGRGIPMIRELAKQFGVAEGEVKDLVTAGKVGFPEVEKVIMSLTSEGGQFGGLMEAQSHTIVGQISNIEDSIDMMFNDMGKSSEGAINTVLSGVSYAVENYEQFGSVLLGIIASYGEWKAAAMIVNSWNNMIANQMNDIEATRQADLTDVAERYQDTGETTSTEANTAATEQNTIARNANKSAIDAEIASIEAALKAKVAEAEADYSNAATKAANASLNVESAQEALDAAQEQYDAVLKLGDGEAIETAENNLNTAAVERNAAQRSLQTARDEMATAAKNKETAAQKLNTFQTEVDTVQKKANTTATGLWAAVTNTATKAVKGLTTAIAANPVGALLIGITTALTLIPMFTSETEAASEEVTRFGEAAVKDANNVETLMSVIESTSDKSKVHKDSMDELVKVYEEYGVHIDEEQDKLQQLIDKHDELIRKIREEGEERQKANLIQSYTEGMEKAGEEMQTAWAKAYANAEYEGSGFFDNYDAKQFQDKAQQIALVANSIAQSEIEQLQAIIESGEQVTEEQVNQAIANAKQKIREQSQQIAGASDHMASYYIDVDYEKILGTYADKVLGLSNARKELVEQIKDTKKNIDEENESVDVSSMSFADLIKKAYGAKEAVEDVGNTDGTPTIDTTPADNATTAIQGTQSSLDILNGMTATPTVNTTSIGNALSMTGSLIGNMITLSNSPLFNGTGKLPQFNFNTSQFNMGGNKSGLGFNTSTQFGFSSNWGSYLTNPIAGNAQVSALNEIANRVRNANTDKDVSKLLKDIGEAIEGAEYGSSERKELLRLQKQLQDRKKANSNSNKTSDKQQKEEEKRNEAAQKLSEKQVEIERQNQEETLELMQDGTEKKLKQIDVEYEERKDKIAKEARELAEQNKKAGINGDTSLQIGDNSVSGLTKKQSDALSESLSLASQNRTKQIQEVYNAEAETMQGYLKQYGTFQQQKLAIAEDYAKKISEAQTEGEKLSLQAEQAKELQQVEISAIKQQVDWGSLFGDFGTIFKDQLQPTIDNLRKIANSDEFKQSSYEEQQSLYEMIGGLENANGIWDGDIIMKLSNSLEAYQDAMLDYSKALQEEEDASERFASARNALDIARANGADEETMSSLQKNASEAQYEFSVASSKVKTFGNKVQETSTEVSTAAAQAQSMFTTLQSGLQGLKSGSLQGIGKGLMELDKLFGNGEITKDVANSLGDLFQSLFGKDSDAAKSISKLFGDTGIAGELISGVLSLLDILSEGIGSLVSSLIDTVLNAVNGILEDVFKGKIVTSIGSSLIDGVGNILDTVSFGGFSSLFSGNGEKVRKTIENLQDSIDNASGAIDIWSAKISDSSSTTSDSIEAANEAIKLQQSNNEAILAQAQAQASYHSSHKSFNHYWEGYSDDQIEWLSNQIGRDWDGSLWSLSPEEMEVLRSNVEMWQQILDTGKGGYGERVAEYLEEYINQSGAIEELEDALTEALTGVSLDSLSNEFKNVLTDMEISASDFADSFNELLIDSIANSLMADKYASAIEDLYNEWSGAMDGGLDSTEIAKLQEMSNEIYESMQEDRDALKEVFGSSYTQSSSSGSWDSMSEDTANELNGRFTAVQLFTSQTAERMLTTIDLLTTISTVQTSQNAILAEIRNMMIYSNSYLEDMVKYAKLTYNEFGSKLDDIVSNTKIL